MNTESEERVKHAIPPPAIYFGFLLIGLLTNQFYRLALTPFNLTITVLGIAVLLTGLVIGASAIREMRRAGVSPDPSKPPAALVVEGAFRFSRNPIYISFAIIYLGISVAFNTPWPFVWLILPLLVVDRNIIPTEERYLERRFGEEYRAYKSRVRRWI